MEIPDLRPEVATWPREKLAAAIAYAREWGAVPDGPISGDPLRWDKWMAQTVHAANEILCAIAAERLTRGASVVQSPKDHT